MHARRLLRPAVALAMSSLLAVAWALGAGACNLNPLVYVPNCFVPQLDEVGADGGPDPCHCNVPPPEQPSSCPCTSTQVVENGLTGIQVFNDCMSLLPEDAGDAAEGGPLPACNGQCWPIPPPDWTPMLLWSGAESDAPACPYVAPTIVFAGNADDASGTFALGCASNASGSCPGFGDVCGPSFADGFLQCVVLDADFPSGCQLQKSLEHSQDAQSASLRHCSPAPAEPGVHEGDPPAPVPVPVDCGHMPLAMSPAVGHSVVHCVSRHAVVVVETVS